MDLPFALPRATPVAGVIGATAGVIAGLTFDSSTPLWLAAVAGAVLAAISWVDIRQRRIPNVITYPGTLIALVIAAAFGMGALLMALAGAIVAGAVLLLAAIATRGGFGMGDVKLAVLVGSVVGLGGVPMFLVAGTGLGALAGVAAILSGRTARSTIAYGPYLAAGALVALLTSGATAG